MTAPQGHDHAHDPAAPFGSGPQTSARTWRLLLALLDPHNQDELSENMIRVLSETDGCTDCLIAMIFNLAAKVLALVQTDDRETVINAWTVLLQEALDQLDTGQS